MASFSTLSGTHIFAKRTYNMHPAKYFQSLKTKNDDALYAGTNVILWRFPLTLFHCMRILTRVRARI